MCLLVVATVTADGRPIAGPVDGIFYRGAFHFGTSPDAIRAPAPARPAPGQRDAPAARGVRGHRARACGAGRHPRGRRRRPARDAARDLRAALRRRSGSSSSTRPTATRRRSTSGSTPTDVQLPDGRRAEPLGAGPPGYIDICSSLQSVGALSSRQRRILVPWRMRPPLAWSNVTSTTSSGRSAIHSSSFSLFQRLGVAVTARARLVRLQLRHQRRASRPLEAPRSARRRAACRRRRRARGSATRPCPPPCPAASRRPPRRSCAPA